MREGLTKLRALGAKFPHFAKPKTVCGNVAGQKSELQKGLIILKQKFPTGTSERLRDNLDFEKLSMGRLKIIRPTPHI